MNTPLSTRIAGYFGALFLAAMASLFALWYFGLPAVGLTGAGNMQLAEVTRTLEREADHRRTLINMAISERRGDILVVMPEGREVVLFCIVCSLQQPPMSGMPAAQLAPPSIRCTTGGAREVPWFQCSWRRRALRLCSPCSGVVWTAGA